jgi:3-oxoacyl-[acyl-carrier protein] reductase
LTTSHKRASSNLEGRTALITGASRGIGAATARRLAENGAAVVINHRDSAQAAEAVAAEIRTGGGRALVAQADVVDAAACAAMVVQATEEFGPISILVNNAGIGGGAFERTLIVDTPSELVHRLIDAHVVAALNLCRLIVPGMRLLDRGDVIVLSSVAAHAYPAKFAVYSLAKAALEAFAHTLAREEREFGVRVNIISPGLIETQMGVASASYYTGITDMRALDAEQPFGFVAQPDDITATIAFLCSPGARQLNDQRIVIDGGTF